jgi:hypothetical protein
MKEKLGEAFLSHSGVATPLPPLLKGVPLTQPGSPVRAATGMRIGGLMRPLASKQTNPRSRHSGGSLQRD